jgi:Putative 2/3 transmembrane domain holin
MLWRMNTTSANSLSRLAAAVALLKRCAPVLVVFLIAFAVVAWLAPVKVGLVVYGGMKLAMAALGCYVIDRVFFPYARPHTLEGIARGAAEKRRAIIFLGCALIVALIA